MSRMKLTAAALLLGALATYGHDRYVSDVLPGEADKAVSAETPLPVALPRTVQDVDRQARDELLARLRNPHKKIYPYHAQLKVTVPGFEEDQGKSDSGEYFIVHAYEEGDWRVAHKGDDHTFVEQSSEALSFGTGWDLSAWFSRRDEHRGGSPLVLPEWMLQDAFLLGIDGEENRALFSFTLQSKPSGAVQVEVDIETGLIAAMTMSFSEYVQDVGIQVMDIRVEVVDLQFGEAYTAVYGTARSRAPVEIGSSHTEVAPLRVGVKPGV